jgi:peptide/nickel transport system permease protein
LVANPTHSADTKSEKGLVAASFGESPSKKVVRRFVKHRLALIGSIFLVLIIAMAIFAPLLATHDPAVSDLQVIRSGPSSNNWLGTDLTGRDVWSRIVYGSRVSLAVGLLAVGLYIAIGTTLGALAGYFGGFVDQIIMRLTDTVMSVPVLLMVIVFVSVIGPSLTSIIIVIGLLGWPAACRLVRGQFLSLREQEFVLAARVSGASDTRIILRHMLVNTVGPLVVLATFGAAVAIILEASLSFLGLGVRPPMASWGGMLNQAQSPTILADMPWLWISPGVSIALTVLAVNFVGDGLRDAIDPGSTRGGV